MYAEQKVACVAICTTKDASSLRYSTYDKSETKISKNMISTFQHIHPVWGYVNTDATLDFL